MSRLSHKTIRFGLAGGLGGIAAWVLVLHLSGAGEGGLLTEVLLGAVTGMCIGVFLWSHEAITGRQLRTALIRAAWGAGAGIAGGAVGAGLGNLVFSVLGTYAAELGGVKALLAVAFSVGLGWALLGAAIGMSGGLMIRSRDRIVYGFAGGALGGFVGGLLYNSISSTNVWSVLAGLAILGMSIGAFISLVEEAFLSAKVKVVKGRHIGREFPLLKDENVIGRDDRSDVCLSGAEGVALQHAKIRRSSGRYTVEADGSGKAVYVNQNMVGSSRLSDGDVIRVGSILLMFTAVRKAAAVILILLLLSGARDLRADDFQVQITQFDLSSFPEVKAYVSITDLNNRAVPGLDKRVLALRENGREVSVRRMNMAGAEGNREPLSMALVVDNSGSMQGNKMEQARRSLHRFISLLEKGDRAALLAFNDTVVDVLPLTDNRESLENAVRALEPGGNTALYDAIARGVESVRGVPGRRAVIVLTDGKANRGRFGIDHAIQAASDAYVSVTVIGLGEDVRTTRLERIAQETGGAYFFTPSEEGLAGIYESISRSIRNEYAVTYDAEERGEYLRTVSIALKGGGEVSERMYFQPQSSLFGTGAGVPGWAWLVPLLCLAGLGALSFRNLERTYRNGHLSLVRGRGTRREIDISGSVTIGRDERNTLGLFRDGAIEQRHAEVRNEDGKYYVRDNASAAGTFVNRQRVTGRRELRDGDVIEIGETKIVFSEGERQACGECGTALRANAKYCPKCGAQNNHRFAAPSNRLGQVKA